LVEIDLISDDHEWERLTILRVGLNQELLAPAVERVEGLGDVHIIHQHTTIRTTIECNTETYAEEGSDEHRFVCSLKSILE
jgi:hypothetical protein